MSEIGRFILSLLIFITTVIICTLFIRLKDKSECYEDYIRKGIIPTSCEKYFKDLGSDNDDHSSDNN